METEGRTRPTGRAVAFPKARVALLLGAGLSAMLGLLAASVRSGLLEVGSPLILADFHGALMIYGFLGSAISLERAAAYRGGGRRTVRWCFLAPAFGALGLLVVLAFTATAALPGCGRLGAWARPGAGLCWCASTFLLCLIYLAIWRRQPSIAVLVQFLAALVGLAGALMWTGGVEAFILSPTWLSFPVLSIVGERVELARAVFSEPRLEAGVLALSMLTALLLPGQISARLGGTPFWGWRWVCYWLLWSGMTWLAPLGGVVGYRALWACAC
ncbi:hypothetical protein [Bifidobacterium actinocoloniiforme]|uniref:hypothetical protein n=1 Tax=Bifidobacterium actinocoloniiforme TaxID=638619 RepID=UPI000A4A3F2C|nr:hypothetical protein [Bifidobacterium actinocoloniiforme]